MASLDNSSAPSANKMFVSGTSDEDIVKHNTAVEFLKTVVQPTLDDEVDHSGGSTRIDEVLSNVRGDKFVEKFKTNQKKVCDDHNLFVRISTLKPKNKGKNTMREKQECRRSYNTCVNRLKQIVTSDSVLNGLMSINDQNRFFVNRPKTTPKKNIVTCDDIEKGECVVTLSKGAESSGRISFEDYEETTRFFKCMLGNATSKDLVVRDVVDDNNTQSRNSDPLWGCCNDVTAVKESTRMDFLTQRHPGFSRFSINIPIKHTNIETGMADAKMSYMNTRDSRLINVLFDGKYPTKKIREKIDSGNLTDIEKVLYKRFLDFQDDVKKKIYQLINQRYADEDFCYMCLDCVRVEPKCKHTMIVTKHQLGCTKLHNCGLCSMGLCKGGCGNFFHGETPCDITFDEASEIEISRTSKPCPSCNVPINKSEGCNHMTCNQCTAEFCFLCGEEFERDEHGRYKVTEHFSGNGIGNGSCSQFTD